VLSGKIAGEEFKATLVNVEVVEFLDGVKSVSELFPKTITGTSGKNTIVGTDAIEIIDGKKGDDKLYGGNGSDTLLGGSGKDRLFGDGGNDTLNGGKGQDKLTGGAGEDTFVFSSSLKEENRDQILDFNVADDTIALDNAVFTALLDGPLAATAFAIGSGAADADDRIIYNSSNGKLYYDADGIGGSKKVHFATLSAGLALTAEDFLVI
jgi:serralysin